MKKRGKSTMIGIKNIRKGVGLLTLGVGLAFLGGCDAVDKLLVVSNPSELQEGAVNETALIPILTNSVEGAMVDALDYYQIWIGSMFTDEQITGVNWEATARLSQRIVLFTEGDADGMFSNLHDLRAMADSVVGRFKGGLIENASSDWRTAYAQAYAGYAYIMLADNMCESTINVGETIYQPLELYAMAVERLEDALSMAGSAGDADIQNLARAGLARAHMNLGNYSQVVTYASAVDSDFQWWIQYAGEDNQDAPGNNAQANVSGANHRIGVHPHFLAGGPDMFLQNDLEPYLTDPRVQHYPYWRTGHNVLSPLYTPYAGLRYSGYNGQTIASGGQPAEYDRGDDILLADYNSAQHDMYEAMDAQGSDPAAVLAFVNARRAVGNQDPVTLSGSALTMELRDQRGRDLFQGGFRLADLRRWLRGGTDMFPSGTHPTEEWGSYGTATCFPMPVEEYEGNPNINKPGG
jgi:tetratricopeptide (TPR) repeat protein